MKLVKAHALGNDFLLVAADGLAGPSDRVPLVRAVCNRHRGIGADGVIFYTPTDRGAAMELLNADGSYSEISGNGVRCLGALLARGAAPLDRELEIDTDAGVKRAGAARPKRLPLPVSSLHGSPTHSSGSRWKCGRDLPSSRSGW